MINFIFCNLTRKKNCKFKTFILQFQYGKEILASSPNKAMVNESLAMCMPYVEEEDIANYPEFERISMKKE